MILASTALALAWQLVRLQAPAPPADEVQWSAPPGCPDRAALLDGVARRRGRALAPGEARIVGRASALGRRFRLELELEAGGRRETRVLHANRCAALVDAAALLVVLAVDAAAAPAPADGGPTPALAVVPEAEATPPEPLPEPSPPEPPPPEPAPVGIPAPPAPVDPPGAAAPGPSPLPAVDAAPHELSPDRERAESPAPAPGRRPGGFVRVQGVGEIGALPGPTGGAAVAGGLLWRRVRVELQATWLAPRAVARPAAEVRASLLAAAALGCARLGRGALEFPLCAGLELGVQRGSAEGPDVRAAAFGRWLAVALGAGVAWRMHPRVALWAAVQGLAAVQRPTFVLRDPGPEIVLFDPGVVSARAALGIELRFGDPR